MYSIIYHNDTINQNKDCGHLEFCLREVYDLKPQSNVQCIIEKKMNLPLIPKDIPSITLEDLSSKYILMIGLQWVLIYIDSKIQQTNASP